MLTTDKFDKYFLFEWENNISNSWNKYFQMKSNNKLPSPFSSRLNYDKIILFYFLYTINF